MYDNNVTVIATQIQIKQFVLLSAHLFPWHCLQIVNHFDMIPWKYENLSPFLWENWEGGREGSLGYRCMHVGAPSRCYSSPCLHVPKKHVWCELRAQGELRVHVHSFLPDLKERSQPFFFFYALSWSEMSRMHSFIKILAMKKSCDLCGNLPFRLTSYIFRRSKRKCKNVEQHCST